VLWEVVTDLDEHFLGPDTLGSDARRALEVLRNLDPTPRQPLRELVPSLFGGPRRSSTARATMSSAADGAALDMRRLLLLGGPPGVGKTTVAPLLADQLAPCAWVDGDDLSRMSPVGITDRARRMVESNIVHVLQEFLAADYEHVFLCWVLHRRDLIERLVHAVGVQPDDVEVVHLVATPDTIRSRLANRSSPFAAIDVALDRVAQIQRLPYAKVDTSTLTPAQVADRLAGLVTGSTGDR
jgi:gluconate kinase